MNKSTVWYYIEPYHGRRARAPGRGAARAGSLRLYLATPVSYPSYSAPDTLLQGSASRWYVKCSWQYLATTSTSDIQASARDVCTSDGSSVSKWSGCGRHPLRQQRQPTSGLLRCEGCGPSYTRRRSPEGQSVCLLLPLTLSQFSVCISLRLSACVRGHGWVRGCGCVGAGTWVGPRVRGCVRALSLSFSLASPSCRFWTGPLQQAPPSSVST